MYDFDAIALAELGALVLRARYDLPIALHGDQRVGEPEHPEELLHRGARLDVFDFPVDHQTHRT
jgi:hypothetical protein